MRRYAVFLGNIKKTFMTLRKVLNKATTTYFEWKDKEISYWVCQMPHIFSLFIFQRNENVEMYNIRAKIQKPLEYTNFSLNCLFQSKLHGNNIIL